MNISNTYRTLKFEGKFPASSNNVTQWMIVNKKLNDQKHLIYKHDQIYLLLVAKINLIFSKTKKYYPHYANTSFFQSLLKDQIVYSNVRGEFVLTNEKKVEKQTMYKLLRLINWKVNQGKKFLLVRTLTSNTEIQVFHTYDTYLLALKRLKIKDQSMVKLIDEIEMIAPCLFDWNVVNDLCEKLIFSGNSFSNAFVSALKQALDTTKDPSSESITLEYFEVRHKLAYAHGFEKIHYHWCLFVQELIMLLKTHLLWTDYTSGLFRNFLMTAERINIERMY